MVTRIVTAVAALVSAYVHLKLWLDGFSDIDMIGPAFMFNAVAGLVIAILLLAWKHWVPGFLAAGFGASTLGAFLLSATVGLFGVHEKWTGGYVWAAAIAEVVCIVGGLLVLREAWPRRQVDAPVGAATDGQRTSGSR
ncbi:MAG TPA: hypothetical protein VFL10_05985 [Ornithinibacter sp.]|nr:hypothetical protein [Ornithinibacter sp.]